jgi:hypothetical protein
MKATVDMVEIVVLAVEELPARETSEPGLLHALLDVVLPPVPGVRALRHHLAAVGALDVQATAPSTVRPSLRCRVLRQKFFPFFFSLSPKQKPIKKRCTALDPCFPFNILIQVNKGPFHENGR